MNLNGSPVSPIPFFWPTMRGCAIRNAETNFATLWACQPKARDKKMDSQGKQMSDRQDRRAGGSPFPDSQSSGGGGESSGNGQDGTVKTKHLASISS